VICASWDREASIGIAPLVLDSTPLAESRLDDALYRLRRARKNCRAGWLELARQDYTSLRNADRLPDCRPPRRDESLMSASSHPELLSGYLAMRPHSGVLRRRAERGLRNRWSRHAPAAAVLVLAAVFVFKQGSRALGLTVPLALLGRADEVIE
jgi:hypothetical protein